MRHVFFYFYFTLHNIHAPEQSFLVRKYKSPVRKACVSCALSKMLFKARNCCAQTAPGILRLVLVLFPIQERRGRGRMLVKRNDCTLRAYAMCVFELDGYVVASRSSCDRINGWKSRRFIIHRGLSNSFCATCECVDFSQRACSV